MLFGICFKRRKPLGRNTATLSKEAPRGCTIRDAPLCLFVWIISCSAVLIDCLEMMNSLTENNQLLLEPLSKGMHARGWDTNTATLSKGPPRGYASCKVPPLPCVCLDLFIYFGFD